MEKTIKFTTGNKEVVGVVLPEGMPNYGLSIVGNRQVLRCFKDAFDYNRITLEKGILNWQLLGNPLKMPYPNVLEMSKTDVLDKLQSLGLVLVNPYQSDWDEICAFGHGDFGKDGKTSQELFMEAQQKLQTVILLWRDLATEALNN